MRKEKADTFIFIITILCVSVALLLYFTSKTLNFFDKIGVSLLIVALIAAIYTLILKRKKA